MLVIGGSGSGKTRYHIKPNLLQMNASYVCSDPKGTVIEEVGRALVRGGYKIKVLNTIDFSCSMHYNPFVYLHSETDILTLVTVIMTNTQGEAKGGDGFWEKAEALLYQALIAYIYYEAPAEERNMNTLLDMLNACECREDDENFKSAVDLLFEQLEQRNPDHFAARQYKKFKMAAGKTLKSILISCGARLAPFDIAAVREMMSYDELELEKLGDEKTALFAVVSDTDPTFNFISAMMYSQMFNVLCDRALKVYHGRLPIHVTCLFDEFANQKIPNWEHLVSVIRSRNISAHIVLQTFSQLKGMYKDNAETVAGCCSTMLFLGGKEESSLKMVSGLLGKETIDTMNESDSRGAQRTYGLNYQKLGKDMISLEKQISDVAEGLKDVVTKSELADMMNSFISDDDEKWLMFNAKFSSADEVYESVYRQAKSSIYVVDNYIGLRTLVHLKNSPAGVDIILFSDNVGNNKLHNIEYTDFRKEYPTVKLSMKKTGGIFHDRFIVLDYGTADERVFLCGASSKDAGARITSIVEDYGIAKYNSVIAGLLKNSPLVLPK